MIRAAEKEDSMMAWEDKMMECNDFLVLSWTEILRIEKNRENTKRWRRAKILKQALFSTMDYTMMTGASRSGVKRRSLCGT